MSTLPARVAAQVRAAPGRIAMTDGERSVGYAAFWAHAHAFAAALRARGLARGARVALLLPNRIEAAVAVYGTWLAGGIAVPMNVQARARDFEPWLRHCGATHVVHEAGHADAEAAIAALDPAPHAWTLQPGQPIVADLRGGEAAHGGPALDTPMDGAITNDAPTNAAIVDDTPAQGMPAPAAPALVLYTSGTTGAPKGVTLSHANLLANAQAVAGYLGLTAGDSVLGVLPFHYAYGASVLHTHLLSGARIVLAPGLQFPQLLLEACARERITGLSGVPSTFALLLDRACPGDHDLSALRYLTQAGGAMPQPLARRLRQALPGPRLYLMYGQTEATSRLTWLPPTRLDDKPGSVGIAVDGVELRIARADGSAAAPGEDGEVQARGGGIMLGYWDAPAATAAVLQDGWLRTGDIGHLDDEGFLFLSGRRSDMIKTGAHRVHPGDIEDAIAELPAVAEVAVAGLDDDLLGQVVQAFVVLRDAEPGAPPATELSIKAHCRARLAAYKIPRHVRFVASLPRTASGKVRRAALASRPDTLEEPALP